MAPAYPEAQRHQGAPPDVRRGSILCSPLQVIRGWPRDLFLSAHAAPPRAIFLTNPVSTSLTRWRPHRLAPSSCDGTRQGDGPPYFPHHHPLPLGRLFRVKGHSLKGHSRGAIMIHAEAADGPEPGRP